jgi:hypothetical protein
MFSTLSTTIKQWFSTNDWISSLPSKSTVVPPNQRHILTSEEMRSRQDEIRQDYLHRYPGRTIRVRVENGCYTDDFRNNRINRINIDINPYGDIIRTSSG